MCHLYFSPSVSYICFKLSAEEFSGVRSECLIRIDDHYVQYSSSHMGRGESISLVQICTAQHRTSNICSVCRPSPDSTWPGVGRGSDETPRWRGFVCWTGDKQPLHTKMYCYCTINREFLCTSERTAVLVRIVEGAPRRQSMASGHKSG